LICFIISTIHLKFSKSTSWPVEGLEGGRHTRGMPARSPWTRAVSALALLTATACGEATPAPKHPEPSVLEPGLPPAREPSEELATPALDLSGLPRSASCKQARSRYVEAWNVAAEQEPDLSRGFFSSVLARGHYFDRCAVPSRYEVSICAAIHNGRVAGATVATSPRAPRLERCIERGVRSLTFPARARMDVATTVFPAL
jgi:hypothetical protein